MRGDDQGQASGRPAVRSVPIDAYRPLEAARIDRHPRYPDAALLTLIVPECSLGCIFCTTPQGDQPFIPSTLEASVEALQRARREGATGLLLTGGEPTSLGWLLSLVAAAAQAGYAVIQMQSHCGEAADPAFADALMEAGLTAVDVPVYGSTHAVHESITNTPGSWEATLSGMSELRRRGAGVVIHNTLFRDNLEHLAEWAAYVAEVGPDLVYLQVTAAVGPPGVYARVAPRMDALGSALSPVLTQWRGPELLLVDVPECVVPAGSPFVHAAQAVRLGARVYAMPYTDWLDVFTEGAGRTWPDTCSPCRRRSVCSGIQREVLEVLGDGGSLPPIC